MVLFSIKGIEYDLGKGGDLLLLLLKTIAFPALYSKRDTKGCIKHFHFGLNTEDYEGDELIAVQEAIDNGNIIEGETLKKADGFIVADILFSYDIQFGNETEMQFYTGEKTFSTKYKKITTKACIAMQDIFMVRRSPVLLISG
nr:hypothetical protein [uncultured Draconibacterium sp.]